MGEFVSIGNSDWAQTNNRLVSTGLEGEWFFDRTTLFSQLIYSRTVQGGFGWIQDLRSFTNIGLNSWYLYTGARYFLRNNLMFEADAGAGTIESDGSRFGHSAAEYFATESNGNILHWSAKTEYRFQDLPVSLAFNYQGSYGTWNRHSYGSGVYPYPHPYQYDYNVMRTWRRTENLFMLSLRYYLGQDSLIANDRNGASMSDYNPWYGAKPVTEAFIGDSSFYEQDSPVL